MRICRIVSLPLVILIGTGWSVAAHTEPLPWRTGGPMGGSVHVIAAAPSNPDRMYAGTELGLFRSDDRGVSWRANGEPEGIVHIIMDPTDENVVYFATADAVYKSTDGGELRTSLPLPAGIRVSALLLDPRDPNTLYVGSACGPIFKTAAPLWHEAAGVYKSTDGGTTWTNMSQGLGSFQQCVIGLAIDPGAPNTLYATPVYNDGGYARTDDGGKTWRTAQGPVPGDAVVVDPDDPLRRYGITSHPGTPHFLVSDNGGESWTEVMPELAGSGSFRPYSYDSLTIDPQTGRLFLGTPQGVYRSGDGGVSWLPLESAGRDAVRGLKFDSSTGELTIATSNGLFRSEHYPWNEWRPLPIRFIATGVLEIVIDPSDPAGMYARSANRVYHSNDLGRSWEPVGEIIPSAGGQPFQSMDLAVGAAGELYIVGFSDGGDHLFRLDRESGNWKELFVPPSPFDRYAPTLRFVTADPAIPGELWVGQVQEFAHTRDGGETWEQVPIHFSYLSALSIDQKNPNILYAATGDGIIKSVDRGASWTRKKVKDQSELVESRIVISRSEPSYLYAFTHFFGPIDRSTDAGETWESVLLSAELTDLAIANDDPLSLFASTLRDGVFRSRDGGETWEQIGEGLPPGEQFRSIEVDTRGAYVHVGTWSRGVWELPLRSPARRRPVSR